MTPEVRVAGTPLATLAPVGGIEVDVRWPLGGYQLDFNVLLGPRDRPPIVAQGARCNLYLGGQPVFPGRISEVDWSGGKVTATGLCRDAETTAALTVSGVTTSTPDVAIDAAVARGAWQVNRPASLSASPVVTGDETADVNLLAALLDLWSSDNNRRWYVDPNGAVRSGVDPTVPELYLLPGVGELSWSVDRQASRLIGRWSDAAGVLHTTMVGTGSVEKLIDLTGRGSLNSTQATSILNSILTQSSSGGWANGVTVSAEQIVTPGGLHPSLAKVSEMVGRGVVARLLGHRDPRPGRFSMVTDVVIGQAVWNVDNRTIALTPVGTVARDLSSIVESFGGSVAA